MTKKSVDNIKENTFNKKTAHFILQSKGGIGKSLIASYLSQFLIESHGGVKCFDCDPGNSTLAATKNLPVEIVDIMDGANIDSSKFDKIVNLIVESDDQHFVIDPGASSFISLVSYMTDSNIIELLEDNNVNVILHSPVAGGDNLIHTVSGLRDLANKIGNDKKRIVVWLNNFFGSVESNGKSFIEAKGFLDMQDKVSSVIELKNYSRDTYGKDIQRMNALRLTFNEVKTSDEFGLVSKSRLNTVKNELFAVLDKTLILEN